MSLRCTSILSLPPILIGGIFLSPHYTDKGDVYMLLMEANHIKYDVRDRLLMDIDHLNVHQNDRIGLVGRNGCGKTTLLQIMAGELVSDEGDVNRHADIEMLPQLKRTDTTKSGGEITQEYIQQALNSHATLLLVDEPTTNLDTKHIEWVEKKLGEWQGALVIVSHDRALLDALCSVIWELKDGKLSEYKGNYSDYAEQKEIEYQQQKFALEKYQKEKKQLEEAIRQKEEQAQRATKKPKNLSSSEARIKGAKPYFANKQKKLRKTKTAIETRLANMEQAEKPYELPPVKMGLPYGGTSKNQIILRAEDISGKVGQRVLWEKTHFYIRGGDRMVVIGMNGSGKTTLIKKIINRESGVSISSSVKVGYFAQNLNILNNGRTILENVQSTSNQDETTIRTVLARMHFFNDDVYKPVEVLSGGERVKVALSKVFLSDVNMLVLDEPTNYLDLESLEALEILLCEYEGTIIFAAHDRRFIENVANRIMEIKGGQIIDFAGDYGRSEEHTSELQSRFDLVCRLLLEKKKKKNDTTMAILYFEQKPCINAAGNQT